MTRPLPSAARLALRSLLIQGSWNYRTFQGAGVAWALHRPGEEGGGRGEGGAVGAEGDVVSRRAGLFRAHPYLAPIALGALAKAEADGGDPERILRFREAMGAPLGSLGDRLIWGTWRPMCLVGAIVAWALGAPPLPTVFGFLVLYNSVHLPLRVRGAAVGLRTGFDVAAGIRELDLAGWAERAASLGVLLLGVALGVALVRAVELPAHRLLLGVGAAASLLAGFLGGESLRRVGGVALVGIAVAGLAFGSASGWLGGP